MAEKKYEITYAAITDKGERTNNEDYLGVGKIIQEYCVYCAMDSEDTEKVRWLQDLSLKK